MNCLPPNFLSLRFRTSSVLFIEFLDCRSVVGPARSREISLVKYPKGKSPEPRNRASEE